MENESLCNNRIKETIETYNISAKAYQNKFMEMDLYNDSYDTFCHLLNRRNARILEIATGPGNVTKYILCQRPDLKVFGIDLSPNMIELAKQNNPQADFAVMDCRDIHAIDVKFDGILCAFCLPYLSKEESLKLLSDASLLLEPDGILYISTMEGDYNTSGYETTSFSGDNRVYVYYHQADCIAACLIELGFEILDLQRKQYPESDGSFLTDMVFIARKKIADLMPKVNIYPIMTNKKQHLDLLLLADEQESMIDRYLERGDMFILEDNGVKAVCVVTDEGNGVCELKNIAVTPVSQRQGYGKKLIAYLINHYSGKYTQMIVGTGDVPSAIGFYQSCGFEYSHRIENFFTDNYDHLMIEEGILLKDMVYLKQMISIGII